MGREEILLKEYEVCQQHINSIGTQVWQATAIFLSVNAAVLAYIFQKEWYGQDVDRFLLALSVSVIFIIILNFLRLWIKRQWFTQLTLYERMREIEDELGMWKNWYMFIPDKLKTKELSEERLKTLPKEKSDKVKELIKNYAGPAGFTGLQWITVLLMVGWGLLIIREFINCCYPEIYEGLFNIICCWCK